MGRMLIPTEVIILVAVNYLTIFSYASCSEVK